MRPDLSSNCRLVLAALLTLTLASACGRLAARADDAGAANDGGGIPEVPPYQGPKVALIVVSGLRADAINATDTPRLLALRAQGTEFADHHTVFPSTAMTAAASLATGSYPAGAGFYAGLMYKPGLSGQTGLGYTIDGTAPLLSNDDGVLTSMAASSAAGRMLQRPTLLQRAQAAGVKTLAIGQAGAALLQDPARGGSLLDEQWAWPAAFASRLLTLSLTLPLGARVLYADGSVSLPPTGFEAFALGSIVRLDNFPTVSDPAANAAPPYLRSSDYFAKALATLFAWGERSDLIVLWFRDPLEAEQIYGPGSLPARRALYAVDRDIGLIQDAASFAGLGGLNIIVTSANGASSVSGPQDLFPTRDLPVSHETLTTRFDISGQPLNAPAVDYFHKLGAPAADGFSASGEVRLADVLYRQGFDAYDGPASIDSPVLPGIGPGADPNTAPKVYPKSTELPALPAHVPGDAVVVARNGGSDLVYVIGHDQQRTEDVAAGLQVREEVGAIFVADRYGSIPGTLPLSAVMVQPSGASAGEDVPDLIVVYAWNERASIRGTPGTEHASLQNRRGATGGLSPADMKGLMIAYGPAFRGGYRDTFPSSIVDVAPTIARLMGFELPDADGRPLAEAFSDPGALEATGSAPTVTTLSASVSIPGGRYLPTSPESQASNLDPTSTEFSFRRATKTLHRDGRDFVYLEPAN